MATITVKVATALVMLIFACPETSGGKILCDGSILRQTELTAASLRCDRLTADTELTWGLIAASGKSVSLAMCSNLSCTGIHPSVTRVSRRQDSYNHSIIDFTATRDMAGTVICSEVFSNGTTVSSNCTQDIVSPLEVVDIRVTANFENWTLKAEFNTSKVFSVLGVYDVEIQEHFVEVNAIYFLPGLLSVVIGKSFELFTDVKTGRDYNRGTLNVTWPIPNRSGKYYYTASFIPDVDPTRVHPRDKGYMTVSKPSQLETNCKFTYVPEVGPINCQCNATSLGFPAGRLRWLVGNEVITSGGYDVKQLQFPEDRENRVNRWHDGKQVTCQLDWVEKQQVFVTDNVAYGPGSVSIEVESDNCLVIAICTVDRINPFRPDMMQWGGLCQGHQGDVCTIKFRGAEDDGKEVTCTVTNHVNNGHSVTASAKVTASDCGTASNVSAKSLGPSVGVTARVTAGVTARVTARATAGVTARVTVDMTLLVVCLLLAIT